MLASMPSVHITALCGRYFNVSQMSHVIHKEYILSNVENANFCFLILQSSSPTGYVSCGIAMHGQL